MNYKYNCLKTTNNSLFDVYIDIYIKKGGNIIAPPKKGLNHYKICGDFTTLYTLYKEQEFEFIIDTEDLQKLIDANLHWHLSWDKKGKFYYVRATEGYHKDNGKYAQHSIYLHRFIMTAPEGFVVDHKEGADKLDNRKINLRVVLQRKNTSNRKGANKNNSTGHRNVNYGWGHEYYCVQFMKDGKRFAWDFPLSQFQEACDFSDIKRVEIFGTYAGNG